MSAVQQQSETRLPAFGRQLVNLRRNGKVPEKTVIIALDNWKWGEGWPRMVVPADLDADLADFRAVAGLEVFLAWSSRKTSIARRDQITKALVSCRPVFLWVVDMAAPTEAFIVVSRKNGLELSEYR